MKNEPFKRNALIESIGLKKLASKSILRLIIVFAIILIVVMPTSSIRAQSVSYSNSLKLQNCTWLLPSDQGLQLMNADPSVWRATATRLESVNINCIIVWAGTWNTDHTINYTDSPATWTQLINTVKSVNPNFVVLALVAGWGIDISQSSYTQTMFNAVRQLLSSAPFDGFNDDLEGFTGSNQNLIDYWQAEASMIHNMGKLVTVDTGVDWSYKIEDVYPYLTNFDYVLPMFYWTIKDSNASTYWDRILSNSPVPVIMGLDVDQEEMNNYPLLQQLSWIDQALSSSPHSKLAGFSIWAYDYWDASGGAYNDFAAWSNWTTKNTAPSPTPSPSSVHTPSPTPSSLAHQDDPPSHSPSISQFSPSPVSQQDTFLPLEVTSITMAIIAIIIVAMLLFKKNGKN
jgi:hypothetical protein